MQRYTKIRVKRNQKGKRHYKAIKYPVIPPSLGDIYIITRNGDRLDILADKYYKNKNLWWIITTSNHNIIRKDSFYLEPGLEIRIPKDINPILDKFEELNS